jgi:SAM-dependent methyltransferase
LSPAPRRHLDLGCGTRPRNPYECEELHGLDIREGLSAPGARSIAAANLSRDPIPFPDRHFDSVSAYDFLEHVPRVSADGPGGASRFPFIELMNEVWRVLKPGGRFYAVFPAYPHPLAFCDPTHVNVLTDKSHRYFTGTSPMGAMYGFHGRFEMLRQHRIHPRGDLHPPHRSPKLALKTAVDHLAGRRSHLVWEWAALAANGRP